MALSIPDAPLTPREPQRSRRLALGLAVLLTVGLLLMTTPLLSVWVMGYLNHLPIQVNAVASQSHVWGGLQEMDEEDPPEPGSPVWLAQHAQPGWTLAMTGTVISEAEQLQQAQALIGPAAGLEEHTPRNVPLPNASATLSGHTWRMAQAIVVLGGGLSRDYQHQIVPNAFTQLRLSQAIVQQEVTGLPILLSGVEAPWMQKWLLDKGVQASWLESRSMNTCENARFTALLLQKQGGAAQVELVTDFYHMPRARRLFAQNGIETVPVVAPLPGDPAPWWPDTRNMTHSRRALHELIAVWRDLWFGEVNCREVP